MAAIYARWIKAGKMTLEDVPEIWHDQVVKLLKEA